MALSNVSLMEVYEKLAVLMGCAWSCSSWETFIYNATLFKLDSYALGTV